MTEDLLQHEIDRLLDSIDGEVTSQSRVVDALLDLRLAAEERLEVVAVIDAALADIPGKTTVTNDWYLAQLETLRLTINQRPVTAG